MEYGSKIISGALACNRFASKFLSPKGFDLMSEDWDICIILDACRYDMMVDCAPKSWTIDNRISPGSESWEFMQKTFVGRELHDTVYVTSNPHAEKIPDETFHLVENVLNTHWDSELRTVLPEDMLNETVKIADRYPNKRIISHWMQPHFPFIGNIGKNLTHRGIKNKDNNLPPHIWTSLMKSDKFCKEQVIAAYYENLEITLPFVNELIDTVTGRCVVTSDHGNLIGESMLPIPISLFGHPQGIRKQELITVPWIVFDNNTRRNIYSESPQISEDIRDNIVDDRLRMLGYK